MPLMAVDAFLLHGEFRLDCDTRIDRSDGFRQAINES